MYILWKQTVLGNVVIHTSLLNTQQSNHFIRTGVASDLFLPKMNNKYEQLWKNAMQRLLGAEREPLLSLQPKYDPEDPVLVLLQFLQAGNQTKDSQRVALSGT